MTRAVFKEYNDALERKYLPGLIITDPMGYNDAHNILLELKQRVEIQVIMTENVPSDRENLVREILKSKLHLNEESGDTITVVRAVRSISSEKPPTPEKLPELSARMVAFWIIIGLLAITAIALWLQRRKEKAKEKKREDEDRADADAAKVNAQEIKTEDPADEEEKEEPLKTKEEIEAERDALEMRLAFAKGELVKIVREYPSIVCRAVEEFIAQGRITDAIKFLESLGWDQSRKLFKDVDSRLWTRVGAALRERERDRLSKRPTMRFMSSTGLRSHSSSARRPGFGEPVCIYFPAHRFTADRSPEP